MTRLVGTVVDEASTTAVSAWVGIVSTDSIRRFSQRKPETLLTARTDDAGSFELSVPKELDTVIVVARAPGRAPARTATIVLSSDEKLLAPLRLSVGLEVRGRVVDESRTPIRGATVAASRIDEAEDTTPAEAKRIEATSKGSGRFVFTGLSAGSYYFRAQRDGYAPRTLREQELSAFGPIRLLEIKLFRGTYLLGRVADRTNRPIAKAAVSAAPGMDETIKTLSDSEGRFQLGPFARGTKVILVASAAGFSPARTDDIVAPKGDVLVMLDQNGTLRGRVLDADSNKAVTRFQIAFHRRPVVPLRTSKFPSSRNFTSSDGRFAWPDVFPGKWTVTVQAAGYQPLEVGLVIPQGLSTGEILLALKKGHSLRGRIFDEATGLAISSANVSYEEHRPSPNAPTLAAPRPSALTDSGGHFRLDGVPPGQITLLIRAPGYTYTRREVATEQEAVDIGLKTGASISGRLLSADGVTPARGIVSLWDLTTATGGSIPTDQDGRFSFTQVERGRYRIGAESPNGHVREKDMIVEESHQISGLVLTLAAGGGIQGTVSGLLPGEQGRTRIEVRGVSDFVAEVPVDDSGSYALHGIPPGRVEILALTALDREISKTVEVSEYDSATVDFAFPVGARVSGRITRAGKPVRFAMLTASPLDGQSVSGEAESSQSGQYAFEGLAGGYYSIAVKGGGRATRVHVAGDTLLNIELPALTISGQVVDADAGERLSDVAVEIKPTGSTTSGISAKTSTDSSGEFTLIGLDRGEYRLSAYKTEYELVVQNLSIAESTSPLTVPLRSTKGSELRVRDASTGRPLSYVYVDVSTDSQQPHRLELPLDERGVGRLPASLGGQDLAISWMDYALMSVPAWNGSALDITLSAGGELNLSVDPVLNGRMATLVDSDGTLISALTLSPVVTLGNLSPGNYRLEVSGPPDTKTYSFSIADGQSTALVLR